MKVLKNEKGQAMVEFALILPILLLLVMGIAEFGMMFNAYLSVQNATREGARIGIVGATDEEMEERILATSPSLREERMAITIEPENNSRTSGETLRVLVNYDYQMVVPFISNLLGGNVNLSGESSMRIE